MKLSDLLLEKFKTQTRTNENPITATVGTTPERILAENPNRVSWIIINLSSNNIYLGLKRDVSANKGIFLSPNGGFASMIYDEDFEMTGYEIWAVASGAGSSVYVLETEIVNP